MLRVTWKEGEKGWEGGVGDLREDLVWRRRSKGTLDDGRRAWFGLKLAEMAC